MSETGTSGINRALSWIKKALQITEITSVPDRTEVVVRPTLDLFGWERLDQVATRATSNPLAAQVLTPVVPDGIIRVWTHVSVEHSDTGVNHDVTLAKRRQGTPIVDTGVPIDRDNINPGELASMIGKTWGSSGDRLIGLIDVATLVGSIVIQEQWIDLPFPGEYIRFP